MLCLVKASFESLGIDMSYTPSAGNLFAGYAAFMQYSCTPDFRYCSTILSYCVICIGTNVSEIRNEICCAENRSSC